MPERPEARIVGGRWRRRLFWSWIGATVLVALYVALAAPLARHAAEGREWVALAVPPLMILMLGTGLGWLLLYVLARGDRGRARSRPDQRPPS